ncbi:MAG: DUF89 family protein [Chloroflexi bacterium]|nr:DUF89 family protein [Chloroflexota bacterium]
MKIDTECPACLERLVHLTVDKATKDERLRRRAASAALETVRSLATAEKVPTQVAGEAQRVIREVTGNRDPYREWKDREMQQARRLACSAQQCYGDDVRSLLAISVLGNAIDFFKDPLVVEREMSRPINFAVDQTERIAEFLELARSTLFMADENMDRLICFVPAINLCVRRVLFVADNAGECFFDLPLVNEMGRVMRVSYVVKKGPVQNDLAEEDLLLSGLYHELKAEIASVDNMPGLDVGQAPAEFREDFAAAELVVAKGMANYETLSELPAEGKVFHLLAAKCPPVARSLGVPVGSYVAMLR